MLHQYSTHTHTSDTKSMQKKYLSHKLALCDDQLTHMVPVPPAELPEINAFTTITRLTFLQTQDEQISNTCK